MRKGIHECANERHAYDLVLLMKILSAEKKARQLKIQVKEERKKNVQLLNKLKKLSQIFEEEQWQTMKLSELLSCSKVVSKRSKTY